eukprot:m.77217 g.77217  ORF g.77217 m.77217 type:complete len:69 (-) comp12505_c1_seq1:33-239(-)
MQLLHTQSVVQSLSVACPPASHSVPRSIHHTQNLLSIATTLHFAHHIFVVTIEAINRLSTFVVSASAS